MIKIGIKEFDDYEKLSAIVHETKEPVFVEVDGKVELVAMSVELYDEMFGELATEVKVIELVDDEE